MVDETALEPRYRAFRVHYPHATLDSRWDLGHGGTVRDVALEHPMARVEAMRKEDAEEYTQSLGQIVGGSWRQIALAKHLGVPKALGLSVEGWVTRLGGYTRLSIEDRREAVLELAGEGESNRGIAAVLGVDEGTVRNARRAENSAPDGGEEANGAGSSAASAENSAPKADEASESAAPEVEDGGNPPLCAAAPVPLEPLSVVAALAAEDRLRPTARPHVAYNSGENEWYTPADLIARVRAVLGEIDLDPASCEAANKVVGAKRYYSIEDDGLCQEWEGGCFLNPPYSPTTLVAQFIDKLIASTGVTEAVVLVNNATETRWCQALQQAASAICLPAGRVRFWGPREGGSCLQGQLLAYLGPWPDAFAEHFWDLGRVWQGMPVATISARPPPRRPAVSRSMDLLTQEQAAVEATP